MHLFKLLLSCIWFSSLRKETFLVHAILPLAISFGSMADQLAYWADIITFFDISEVKFNTSILQYEVLETLEFTSDRKRMSVVLKDCQNGKILLLSKGADEAILPYARAGQIICSLLLCIFGQSNGFYQSFFFNLWFCFMTSYTLSSNFIILLCFSYENGLLLAQNQGKVVSYEQEVSYQDLTLELLLELGTTSLYPCQIQMLKCFLICFILFYIFLLILPILHGHP